MSIFLTGGGDQEVFQRLDKQFFDELPNSARIAVLAHATDDPEECLERIEQDFNHKKIESIDLIDDPSETLLDYDALIVEGGNTFQLIRAIRDSAFFDLIKSFAQSGKTIYADSAGAIMLGSDVHTAFLGDDADEDEERIQDYRGLDIIHPWIVHAHATSDEIEDLKDILYSTGCSILALPEETGVKISGDRIDVFGNEPLWILTFSGTNLVSPGESVDTKTLLGE